MPVPVEVYWFKLLSLDLCLDKLLLFFMCLRWWTHRAGQSLWRWLLSFCGEWAGEGGREKKLLVSMFGSHGLVSGCELWIVCLHRVQPLRIFRQHCWQTLLYLCVSCCPLQWLRSILSFRVSFVFPLWVLLRSHVLIDVLGSSWWAVPSKLVILLSLSLLVPSGASTAMHSPFLAFFTFLLQIPMQRKRLMICHICGPCTMQRKIGRGRAKVEWKLLG